MIIKFRREIQKRKFRYESYKNSVLQIEFCIISIFLLNPIALRKAKIVYNFDLSECNRVKNLHSDLSLEWSCINRQGGILQMRSQ